MTGQLLVADRADGRLFAYVAEARFTTSEVSASRLGASLHPFPDETTARTALEAAGGANVRPSA